MNQDNADLIAAQGKYRDEEYERWLDERAEEWEQMQPIMEELEAWQM